MGTHVMIKSPKSPMPMQVQPSKTSDIDHNYAQPFEEDLFEKCFTLHTERSKSSNASSTRQNTLNRKQPFFVVNKQTFLKFHIDETGKNYMTLPIFTNTKAIDAIQKITTRRKLPSDMHCKLFQDNEEIADDANLYDIMQVSSSHIQVRFISNTHHSNDDDEKMDQYLVGPPKSSKHNLNLIANHHFSVRQSDDSDGMNIFIFFFFFSLCKVMQNT